MKTDDAVEVEGSLDDGLIDIDGDEALPDDENREKVIEYDVNALNMIPELMRTEAGKDAVKEIGSFVCGEVRDAWDAQEKYRNNAKAQWMMFAGDLPEKTFPYKNCANMHIPQLMEDASRAYMRMYVEVFEDPMAVFSVDPVGPDDMEVASILTLHGNWQFANELSDFPQQMERAFLFFIIPGDVTCHSFYDAHRKVNRHEVLSTDDVIVPYVHTTTTPDYSDCPWLAKWVRVYKHGLQRYRGTWHDVDAVLKIKPTFDDDDIEFPLADGQKKMDGNEPGPEQRAPYKFVHYEGWIELPNQKDELFCKVIVHYGSKQVMLLQLLMEDDWKDRQRFERQSSELQVFRTGMQTHRDSAENARINPVTVDPMTGMQIPAQVQPPPPPPNWVGEETDPEDEAFEIDPIRQVPIHMFVHGKGIEAPHGPLGVGTGRILTDLNKVSNILMSQFIDQGTMANSWGGLFAGGTNGLKEITFEPGVFKNVPGIRPADLKNAFYEFTPRPGNQQLFDTIKFSREMSQAAVAAPDVLSGEAGKSGETYRGLQARIGEATKQISFITGKAARFVKRIVVNNGKLNAQFMPEDELYQIANHKMGTVKELRLGRKLYDRNYSVTMNADLRFVSQAVRVQEADQLLAMVSAPNPTVPPNPALVQAAMRERFLAGGKDHLIPLLGPPLPPPPTGMNLPPQPPPGTPVPGQEPPPVEGSDPNVQPAQPAQVPQPAQVAQPAPAPNPASPGTPVP